MWPVLLGVTAFWTRPVDVFHAATAIQFRLSGAESRWTTVDGYRTHYYVSGPAAGQVVVLVHGLGGRSDDWVNLAPYLSRAGYRVYMPDLPGFGQSERPANFSYSVPDQASFVISFFDALGLKQVDLGGWSMGGWIAQLIAAKHPERVRRLMLFDSVGLYMTLDWDPALFTPESAGQIKQLDGLLMPHPPPLPGFVARDILRYSQQHAWVIRRALTSMLTGHDTTDKILPQLKMPVLIVWGADDLIVRLSVGQKMHALIPQSQLAVIDGCGHLAPNQCAGQIGPTVVDFLKR
jgi:pimeloyl-ACP methyl ester carboxylesterase